MDRLKERVIEKEPILSGEIRIGASTIPGSYILPSKAAEFKKKYPGVYFEIFIGDTREVTEMVLSHRIVLGVVGAELEPHRLKYQKLMDDEIVLAAHPDLIEDNVLSMDSLGKIPFVLREEGSGTRRAFEEALQRTGLSVKDLNVVAVLGSTDAVKQALKKGLGVSFISRLAIEEELSEGHLKVLEIKDFSIKRAFSVVTHPKRTLPERYTTFLEFLLRTEG